MGIIDEGRNLWSLVPFVHSYLSIGVETDKIHYILLYKYQKRSNWKENLMLEKRYRESIDHARRDTSSL